MRKLLALSAVLFVPFLPAQTTVDAKPEVTQPAADPTQVIPQDYQCPMDHDIRSDKPGVCPRCGMKLVLGIPEPVEFTFDVTSTPAVVHPGQKVKLTFTIKDPKTSEQVTKYEIVHEKLFHMFIVSTDLKYFVHDHPVLQPDGTFTYEEVFPKAGMYRVVGDFYPTGATPQLIPRTVFVQGGEGQQVSLGEAQLTPDLSLQHGGNTDVELTLDPVRPIVGMKTLMFFRLKNADNLQKYLGAWAHLLAASDDTIDMIHDHPFIADGGAQIQFNMIFPRARNYRVWIQFQRDGVVNTVAFNIPVYSLEEAGASQ